LPDSLDYVLLSDTGQPSLEVLNDKSGIEDDLSAEILYPMPGDTQSLRLFRQPRRLKSGPAIRNYGLAFRIHQEIFVVLMVLREAQNHKNYIEYFSYFEMTESGR
jgi:hypothetical protein